MQTSNAKRAIGISLTQRRRPSIWEEDRHPLGEAAALPSVICVALLHSDGPDPTKYSSLMVIWFQSSCAFPIEDAALGQIKEIDWDAKAAVDDI